MRLLSKKELDDFEIQLGTINGDLREALKIMNEAHEGQTRWDGSPYKYHPLQVAWNVRAMIPSVNLSAIVAALLHDVVEDSDFTFDDLRDRGVDEMSVIALYHVTKIEEPKEEYADFIVRTVDSGNLISHLVKLGDLYHNVSDLKRGSMRDKYRLAIYVLETSLRSQTGDKYLRR
jgi:(p)ppGpp synthase/HD superfamily hydrolase